VLKVEDIPEAGDKAVRAIENKVVELGKTLPEGYNRPLFDLSTLSPEHLGRLGTINDGAYTILYTDRSSLLELCAER
jgi:hypothetical protein